MPDPAVDYISQVSKVWRSRTAVPFAVAVLATVLAAGCTSSDSDGQASTEGQKTAGDAVAATSPAETEGDAEDASTEVTGADATTDDELFVDETTDEVTTTRVPEETTSTEEEASTEEDLAPSGDVIVVSDWAAFTTPAQAAYCLISGPDVNMAASISCEVAQGSVPAGESLMGICDSDGIGWYFNFFADSGHGGFFCNLHAGITSGGGNPHYWQDDPWINQDNVVTLPSGARVAVLDYGRVMRAGDMDCSVQPDGLTCAADGSGHGFTVNSASYVSW